MNSYRCHSSAVYGHKVHFELSAGFECDCLLYKVCHKICETTGNKRHMALWWRMSHLPKLNTERVDSTRWTITRFPELLSVNFLPGWRTANGSPAVYTWRRWRGEKITHTHSHTDTKSQVSRSWSGWQRDKPGALLSLSLAKTCTLIHGANDMPRDQSLLVLSPENFETHSLFFYLNE